jgi:hypothetical protein
MDLRVMKAAKTFLTDTKGFKVKDVLFDNDFVNIIALDEDENIHAIRVTYSFTELNDDNVRDLRDVAERECFSWLASKSGEYDFVLNRILFDCIDMVATGNQALLRFHSNVLC